MSFSVVVVVVVVSWSYPSLAVRYVFSVEMIRASPHVYLIREKDGRAAATEQAGVRLVLHDAPQDDAQKSRRKKGTEEKQNIIKKYMFNF